jgi:curved DNA-binding protein CbpA
VQRPDSGERWGKLVRDLYQILGIRRSAAQDEIQKAYRRRAKSSHPDAGGSVEAFGELSTAYAVLSVPGRRERYDRTGEIDLPRLNNLDASAVEIVAQKLGLIIHAEQDVTSMDIAALIEHSVREDIDQRRAGIAGLKRALVRTARLRDRVRRKSKGEDNMLAKVLDWHEITTRSNIRKHEESVRSMERSLEILRDYSFADEFSTAATDDVSGALHDALKALDQLALMLNSSQAGPEVVLGEPSPSAFG